MEKEWFASWFDSPYYHILYKNRDEQEAKAALDNLLRALALQPGAKLLDLACGKGRHARYLAEKGFDVTGLDISFASIAFARQFESEHLAFYQHDMRLPYRHNYYDAVVNFFTSFGYFATDQEHLNSLKNVAKGLRPNGLFLLDYFNAEWVRHHVVRSEEKMIDNIRFHLKKTIRGPFVHKTVEFTTGGREFTFRERVRLFSQQELRDMLTAAGMRLKHQYGDYDLSEYDPAVSKRLIVIAEKIPV